MSPVTFFASLVIQSALQSLFLVYYFQSQNKVRDFLIFMAIFDLLIYPLNATIVSVSIFLRNFVNMLVLILSCRLLYRQLPWKKILIGVLLYEVCLVLTDILATFPTFLFPRFFMNRVDFIYYVASGMLALVMYVVLWLFSSPFRQVIKAASAVICLLMNLICSGLCILGSLDARLILNFELDYSLAFMILIVVNSITLYFLIKTIQKSSHQKAIDEIRKVYQLQVEDYLINQKEEEQLRKLRHDLLNFIQSTTSHGGSSSLYDEGLAPGNTLSTDENQVSESGT